MSIYKHMCVCAYICIYITEYDARTRNAQCICMYIYTHVYIYMCVFMYICVHVCIYVHIYMYIYTYLHIPEYDARTRGRPS